MLRFIQFVNVEAIARHAIHLIESEGETAIDEVKRALAAVRGFTGRDLPAAFAALDKVNADTAEIVAAVKAEFGIE